MKERWQCFLNKKSLKRWAVCIGIALIIGMTVSMGYAGIQYWREGSNHAIER